ncbi:hypothetical protein [Paraliomyxa miuraensis]|uniref:hypothetical protein n=1 Tax=Paraliomyxa miuraensis TaxID=376150 RepID=UPI00225324C1|nr:hypothetical protein [Paraliomyxa miuraensis]MCX4244150.1 hypothetical protein [Paraliomyxa miuraensis]
MSKISKRPRTIIVAVTEIGILLAVGAIAVALVGNDGEGRAEESAAHPGSSAKP